MDVVAALGSFMIQSNCFVLDSNLRVKIVFRGPFAWQIRENSIGSSMAVSDFKHESNISAFADLFHKVYFDGDNENLPNRLVEDAIQLIGRCRVKDLKSRPTMENVVKEMETWNLT
ncbi:hypothetical protein M378DRAFT_164198 [Amanita muscaria Koide BX008]|uniref:Uncharacterized protein n=1 Tax=Amanita muscaria (strain Koide BX008) TaxID=946122 RepID=A0A0C2TAK1_AMAMK|nr:hypothetical protein M378DRAFT_164198 [Amanita muscaria Koide BX008]